MKMLVGLLFGIVSMSAVADDRPWTQTCKDLTPKPYSGIYPSAMDALTNMSISHRILRGLDPKSAGDNVHEADPGIGGKKYTGAVDLSVRCLRSPEQIQAFLNALADNGFAAWYRQGGMDGWRLRKANGERNLAHIHAVWTGEVLKDRLRKQVASWLTGDNGLESAPGPYTFWDPNPHQRTLIQRRYEAANPQR